MFYTYLVMKYFIYLFILSIEGFFTISFYFNNGVFTFFN